MWKLICLCLTFCTAVQAAEQARIVVAANEIPNLLNTSPQNPAMYNHLLNQMDMVSVVFMSPARIEVEFDKPYVNCLFPASKNTIQDNHRLIESLPVQRINAYWFVREQHTLHLRDKRLLVAIRRGFTFGGVRQSVVSRFVELNSDLETLRFLDKGRVDALIAYLPDIQAAAQSLGLKVPVYDDTAPIYVSRDAFVCHDTQENRLFLQQIEPIIKRWQQDHIKQ